ncbi:MAG: hypothetical protein JW829_11040, partial [Pirellulales bacterium]|nr:hypothetical protein [Pirellulales bacterium]
MHNANSLGFQVCYVAIISARKSLGEAIPTSMFVLSFAFSFSFSSSSETDICPLPRMGYSIRQRTRCLGIALEEAIIPEAEYSYLIEPGMIYPNMLFGVIWCIFALS